MRTILQGKLTYANVVSTLCLFLLLAGGAAYGASKLAKNSVGTKQIKNNSITVAKIKDGAVTGRKIALSTLGKVPAASHADTADSAGTATNAVALSGLPGSSYARSDRLLYGTANPDSATAQLLFVASGLKVKTWPAAGAVFKVGIENVSSDVWEVSESYGVGVGIAPGEIALFEPPNRVADLFARDVSARSKAVLLQCGSDFSPDILDCFAQLSPDA